MQESKVFLAQFQGSGNPLSELTLRQCLVSSEAQGNVQELGFRESLDMNFPITMQCRWVGIQGIPNQEKEAREEVTGLP